MNLGTLENKINPFANDLNKQLTLLFKKNEKIIIGLNRTQLLSEGINVDGNSLPDYKPVTVAIRRSKGKQVGHMDLNFTGAFQQAMFVNYQTNGFTIESQDYKESELNKRYDQVLGLTDENMYNLTINTIIPQMLNKIFI